MRVARGLGSLSALLGGLLGVPALLVVIGQQLVPASLSWSAVLATLLQPDNGFVVLRLLFLVATAAWVVFAVSTVAEIIGFASGYRISVRLPGLGAPQRFVAGLLLGVVAMLALPQPSATAAPTSPAPTTTAQAAAPQASAASDAAEATTPARPASEADASREDDVVVHRVERGDDLWSLAERYYGQGQEWRRIAAANPERLTGGPDRLEVGWRLAVPGAARHAEPIRAADEPERLVVREGDTLTSIAERAYGDGDRWRDIYRANSAVLSDPDELRVGMTLVLPAAEALPRHAAEDSSAPDGTRPAKEASGARTPAPPAGPSVPSAAPSAAPSAVPTADVTTPSSTAATAPATAQTADVSTVPEVDLRLAAALAGVGGLLAAGFAAGLRTRRRLQLQARPLGRRIAQPGHLAQTVEATVGRQANPLSVRSLDLVLRAVSAHAHARHVGPPRLDHVTVGDEQIVLVLAQPYELAPDGFEIHDLTWTVRPQTLERLRATPSLSDAPRPYPALVTVGSQSTSTVLVDLESTGLLAVRGSRSDAVAAWFLAAATELAFSPGADELFLTFVGGPSKLPDALAKHNVSRVAEMDEVLTRLESRAAEQRRESPEGFGRRRVDPDLADPWAPEVLLVADQLTRTQERRLSEVVTAAPPTTLAVVLAQPRLEGVACLVIEDDQRATLAPAGMTLRPQLIGLDAYDAVVELVAATGDERTTAAPWWSPADPAEQPPEPPPDIGEPDAARRTGAATVAYLNARAANWAGRTTATTSEEVAQMITVVESDATPNHPVLRMLGPVELDGAAGEVPGRAAKQCLEYCGWLLEHPRSTAPQMASALAIAEGTRRSNMSRLRSWLGVSSEGEAFLPDAYTGRIALHPAVSSDWHWVQIFTAGGIPRASDDALHAALGLVRGAPLADAAPGQWHWAEELRTDMISAVRDIGVELSRRCLADADIDGARWAAARALLVCPGDELLMVARIRTEHRAGNRAEVERLTLQVAAQARQLGVDLTDETVVALQEVMEGRARARMA